jgi:hypothetical protein
MSDEREQAKPGAQSQADEATPAPKREAREIGGPQGPEPTRYGDWERAGRCIDF